MDRKSFYKNPNLLFSVKDEDKYLENVIGLKRNDMNHWTMGSNSNLPTNNILAFDWFFFIVSKK